MLLAGLPLTVLPVQAHEGPHVQNTASAPGRLQVKIVESGGLRIVTSNGLPDHRPGQFPNRGNPNAIRAQRYQFRMPLEPQAGDRPTPAPPHLFGVALNGVVFDPGTAEFWNNDRRSGWNYDALSAKINLGLDAHHAHVQPGGVYHYHGIPTGLLQKLEARQGMTLIGYAADGFPIYGQRGYADPMDPGSGLKQLAPSYQLISSGVSATAAPAVRTMAPSFDKRWERTSETWTQQHERPPRLQTMMELTAKDSRRSGEVPLAPRKVFPAREKDPERKRITVAWRSRRPGEFLISFGDRAALASKILLTVADRNVTVVLHRPWQVLRGT